MAKKTNVVELRPAEPKKRGRGGFTHRGGSEEQFSVRAVGLALVKSGGVITEAARIMGEATGGRCTRETVRNYLDRHPELREMCEEALEQSIDRAETKLLDAVERGDVAAIKFFLETRGKFRGYTKRQEVTGPWAVGAVEVSDAREKFLAKLDDIAARLQRPIPNRTIELPAPEGPPQPPEAAD